MTHPKRDWQERFWERVKKTESCWNWIGAIRWDWYGHFTGEFSKTRMAHRYAYLFLVGPIPEGLTLDHKCRNRKCVNPEHLEPVTIGENVLRGIGPCANNKRKTHCPRGHEYTEVNTKYCRGRRHCIECKKYVDWHAINSRRPKHLGPPKRRGRPPVPLSARKTHCMRGHEFNNENIYWKNGGRRECITCAKNYQKTRRASVRC